MVVQHGRDKDLDILINDENYNVRKAVAEHGRDKDLDILVHDNDSRVRGAVADQGRKKDLDILLHDNFWGVRWHVAKNGNLEHCQKLLHDECICVEQDAYNRICEIKNKERELKQKKLINNEINDKPNNKIVQYEIIQ